MATNAWDPFDRLYKAIEEAVNPLGIDLEQWQIMPNKPGDRRFGQMIFTIREDAFLTDEDKALQGIMEATQVAESDERAHQRIEQAKSGLLNISRKGIFDDDAPEE